MATYDISSIQNPRVKEYARLHDRKGRRETGLVLVEGLEEIALALDGKARLRSLLYCPELLRPGEDWILARTSGASVQTISLQVLAKLTYREHPDAWLGVFSHLDTELATFTARLHEHAAAHRGLSELYVLTEDVEKPGNLGAILRSVDAAGARGLIAARTRTDLANPNVVRASKGTVFTVPCAECGNEEALEWIKDRGLALVAATPSATEGLWSLDLSRPTVIAVGAEKEGLSDFWLSRADHRVIIPMYGRVNSINVAQAATLFLYEAARQRQAPRG